MTENEAKEILEEIKALDDSIYQYNTSYLESLEVAIKALEEIQQYRSIGTVEECREAAEGQRAKKVIIARARNEKEVVSKGDYVHYKCPNCEKIIGSAFYYPPNEYMMGHKFCDNCGQAISWEESEGEDV